MNSQSMLMPFMMGLGMAVSMIVALGPQNVYLIQHGLMRRKLVYNVAMIYIGVDAILITIGALGVGSIIASIPLLKLIMTNLAVFFLAVFGVASFRAKQDSELKEEVSKRRSKSIYKMALVLSLLNPGVLFDTVVLSGGLASRYGMLSDRILFSAGALTASVMWFLLIATLSYRASGFLLYRVSWSFVGRVTGVTMIGLAMILAMQIIPEIKSL